MNLIRRYVVFAYSYVYVGLYIYVYLIQIRGLLIKYTEKKYISLINVFDIYKQEIWEMKETFEPSLLNLSSHLVKPFADMCMSVLVHTHIQSWPLLLTTFPWTNLV